MEHMHVPLRERVPHHVSIGAFERLAALTTATAVVAYGLSRRTLPGVCLAAAATPLAYRGLAGEWPRVGNGHTTQARTRAALGGERGIHVRESVRLEQPIAEVYRFWRHFENLPRFMNYLEQVSDLGDGRSRWVARGPAGHARHLGRRNHQRYRKQSHRLAIASGSRRRQRGIGQFRYGPKRTGTQVTVHLQYAPPAGRAGSLVAVGLRS